VFVLGGSKASMTRTEVCRRQVVEVQ